MKRDYKNNSPDNFDTAKRFLQWAYYEGGLGMIFIIFWILLILIFAVATSFFNWCKVLVLLLGIISIALWLYLKNKDDKKWNSSPSK